MKGKEMKQNEALVEAVKNLPVLYDTRKSDYRVPRAREKAWLAVAKEMGRPADDCKRRFKALRDRFVKETKKGIGQSTWKMAESLKFLAEYVKHRSSGNVDFTTESGGGDTTLDNQSSDAGFAFGENELEDSTDFIPTAYQQKDAQSSSTADIESSKELSSAPSSPPDTPPPKRRKMTMKKPDCSTLLEQQILKVLQEEETDEDRLFVLSLVPSLKRLNDKDKSMAKIKMQLLVHELQYGKTSL